VIVNYVDTMKIEEKYGFNRSTVKTFIIDQIRNTLIGMVLGIGLGALLCALHRWLGDGMVLLFAGCVFAIGLFISALTENQFVAAITTIAIIAALLFISFANSYIGAAPVRVVLSWISIFSRFYDFTYGILNFASLLYYASIMFVFLFLTVRVYENRRWA
jgi:hypothetical protein